MRTIRHLSLRRCRALGRGCSEVVPVVFPVVAQVFFVDLVFGMDGKTTLLPQQREIIIDDHAAVVEQHVVVGAKAEYVVRGVRSVVGRSERAAVRGLRVGAGEALQARAAYLAAVVVEGFDPPRLGRVSDQAQHLPGPHVPPELAGAEPELGGRSDGTAREVLSVGRVRRHERPHGEGHGEEDYDNRQADERPAVLLQPDPRVIPEAYRGSGEAPFAAQLLSNGLVIPFITLGFGSVVLLPLLTVLVTMAFAVAGEISAGALKTILGRSVGRSGLFWAKAAPSTPTCSPNSSPPGSTSCASPSTGPHPQGGVGEPPVGLRLPARRLSRLRPQGGVELET